MKSDTLQASVQYIKPLTDQILQLIIKPDRFVDYQAGQYLQILWENHAFSYSIANAPLGSHQYELHIRHTRDNPYNQTMLNQIKREGRMNIRVPMGSCYLSRLHFNKPILFIAGGTGFAPIKAMIEQLLADGDQRTFELFWGARSQSDLYMNEEVLHWQTHVDHFDYCSHLSKDNMKTLTEHVLDRHSHDLHDWQMVLSGPFEMVYTLRDRFVSHGVSQNNLFSDAFE